MRQVGKLDPIELQDVARAIQDGERRDVKVAGAPLYEYVRVTGILIRRDEDLVELAQAEVPVRIQADAIMWMRPTAFDPETAEPVQEPEGATAGDDKARTVVFPLVNRSVAFVFSIKEAELNYRKNSDWRFTSARYVAIRTMYELTDLSAPQICNMYGYRSPMPFQSAMSKHARKKDNADEMVRNVVKLVREQGDDWRRSEEAGRHHCVA